MGAIDTNFKQQIDRFKARQNIENSGNSSIFNKGAPLPINHSMNLPNQGEDNAMTAYNNSMMGGSVHSGFGLTPKKL